ncbi:Alpha/Beta hydrolase protein, partial [Microdochium bolleyi]
MAMQYYTTNASDGCSLAFQSSLPLPPSSPSSSLSATASDAKYDRCIVLMHGFSGSSEYFTRNFAALAAHYWVIAPDMRGHGRSGRPTGGYHVARLAADLRTLLRHLERETRGSRPGEKALQFVPVGCSIGAAVLWTYAELFGHGTHDDDDGDSNGAAEAGLFAGYIFVDQAPLQDRVPSFLASSSPSGSSNDTGGKEDLITWDASRAHTGCYDEATMHAAQRAWVHDTANAHKGLVAECLGYRFAPSTTSTSVSTPAQQRQQEDNDEAFFTSISAQCDPVWLARLLADHTRYDHRDAIGEVVAQKPVLVMAGGKSGCFPLEGMLETARRVD